MNSLQLSTSSHIMGNLYIFNFHHHATKSPTATCSLITLPSTRSSSSIRTYAHTSTDRPGRHRGNQPRRAGPLHHRHLHRSPRSVHSQQVHTTPAAISTSNSTLFIYSTLYNTAHNHLVTIPHCIVRGYISAIHPSL